MRTELGAGLSRAGMKMVELRVAREEFDGQIYWFPPSLPTTKAASPTVHLLPGFDEYLLGYRDHGAVPDPAHAKKVGPGGGNGMFRSVIVSDGIVSNARVISLDFYQPVRMP